MRRRWLKLRVENYYLPAIQNQQHSNCIGCETDHPSQKYHSCLGIGISSSGRSHPVDDYLYLALEEKPKDEDIDAVLGSLIEDPKGHVQLWENEDDWTIDVEKELRKFWKEVPGLRMILPTWRKETENC
ncbi:hypothetical protein LOTGIDRAFT_170710 [Lottia gigantea]|uniref:Uncharacterized protein n=1 Tax=Lottia gigantea TaxID=225164 RepID=V4CPW0_LOTGI|nr:hypothetical protein LOTGIDRAFT_170710 [Lottia gigantea]ESP04465.1 hypothetical protein LOTGIDRAFT_170710 [Lottia gigantea]